MTDRRSHHDDDLLSLIDELEAESRAIDARMSHLDALVSWHDFLIFEAENLAKLQRSLADIREQSGQIPHVPHDVRRFRLGLLWMGAVAAYEGAMHELFVNTLRVESLRAKALDRLRQLIRDGASPHRDIKTADAQSVTRWFTLTTIADPLVAAKRFDTLYGIATTAPDPAWCRRVLGIRNAFAHRNGIGVDIREEALHELIDRLDDLASEFHSAFLHEAGKLTET